MQVSTIQVSYRAVDGFSHIRRFKTLKGAQRFAHRYVGAHPDLGSYYAVSDDGIGTVRVSGLSLEELFPGDEPTEAQIEASHEAAQLLTIGE